MKNENKATHLKRLKFSVLKSIHKLIFFSFRFFFFSSLCLESLEIKKAYVIVNKAFYLLFFYFWLENIFYRAYTEIKSYLFGKVFDKNLTSVWFVNAFSTPTLFPVLFHFFPFGGGHKSLFFTILLSPPFWLVRFELASY